MTYHPGTPLAAANHAKHLLSDAYDAAFNAGEMSAAEDFNALFDTIAQYMRQERLLAPGTDDDEVAEALYAVVFNDVRPNTQAAAS